MNRRPFRSLALHGALAAGCAMLFAALPGCGKIGQLSGWTSVAVPLGRRVDSRREQHRKPVETEPRFLGTEFSATFSESDGAIKCLAETNNRVRAYERVTSELNVERHVLMVGLLPGCGQARFMGKDPGERFWWAVWGNIFLGGVPTVGPLLSVPFDGWSQTGLWQGDSSAIGYAKAARSATPTETTNENVKVFEKKLQVKGATVACADRASGFRTEAQTDANGEAVFDIREWPVLCKGPAQLTLSTSHAKYRFPEKKLEIRGGIVGSKLFDALWSGRREWAKIYTEEGPVDFSKGSTTGAPRAEVKVDQIGQKPELPGKFLLAVTASNSGRDTLYQLLGKTVSEETSLAGHFLPFGKIEPGKSVTRTITLPVRQDLKAENAVLTVEFNEANGYAAPLVRVALDAQGLRRPKFAIAHEILDDPKQSKQAVGNADGVIQKGEAFDLLVTVKNIGEAGAVASSLALEMPQDTSIVLYSDKEQPVGDLAPGQTVTRSFNISVKAKSALEQVRARVRLNERAFPIEQDFSIDLPFDVAIGQRPLQVDKTYYVRADQAVLRAGASDQAGEVARAPKGSRLHAVVELSEWVQVELATEEKGEKRVERVWVTGSELTTERPEQAAAPIVVTRLGRMAPRITFVAPRGDVTTDEERLKLVVSVVVSEGTLKDVALSSGATERNLAAVPVAASSVKSGEAGGGDERVLERLLDLAPGPNLVKVAATDDQGKTTVRSITITRRPKVGTTYLVAVGINTYPEGHALACARQDAEAFAAFAQKAMGVKPENCFPLLDRQATRQAVMKAFGGVRSLAKKEDTVVVFLAAHGTIDKVGSKEEKYLVPVDADWRDLFSTGIGMDEFARILAMEAERVLVVADVCYSGAIRTRGPGDLFQGIVGKGIWVIGYEGPAREDAKLGHGYLTHYLLEALGGAGDANRDGKVTVHEAFEYANQRIRKQVGTGLYIKGEGDIEILSIREKQP